MDSGQTLAEAWRVRLPSQPADIQLSNVEHLINAQNWRHDLVVLPAFAPVNQLRMSSCIPTFGSTAGSMAEDGLDFASDFVSDLPLMGEVRISLQRSQRSFSVHFLYVCKLALARSQGSVLADLSEEDLKKAHLKVDLDFQASRLKLHYQVRVTVSESSRVHKHIPCWLLHRSNHAAALASDGQGSTSTLTMQDLIKRAEHASARRTQRRYTELRRKQYRQNNAAKELRQQGKYLQEYLLQKVLSGSFMHKLGICCTKQCSPYLLGKCLDAQAVVAWI